MGQHHSHMELATEARRATQRFDDCEIKVIRETFKDLCHLSQQSTRIDKETFLQYFPLPGLLGERLFAVFDKKGIGEVDYEEFICGLAITCRGSWEEKVEFVFHLYDVHNQGAVNKEELAALLNHVPKSVMNLGKAVSMDHGSRHNSMQCMSHPQSFDKHVPPSQRLENGSTHNGRNGSNSGLPPPHHRAPPKRPRSHSNLKADSVSPPLPPPPRPDRSPTSSSDVSLGTEDHPPLQHHHLHYDDFTNNDIVEQAFEECDLNHDGKLSYVEFRLWVERNPVVTRFLQSVFPYDEYRDWGNDEKHLPFIHNKEFIPSPPNMSAPGSACGESLSEDDEETVRRLLLQARELTHVDEVREGLSKLLDILADQHPPPNPGALALPHPAMRQTTAESAALSHLSPRTHKVLHHQTMSKMGSCWKQGHRLRTWKQRWIVVVGNCIYYYSQKSNTYPRGVIFLTGSFVEAIKDEELEKRGYWGFEIIRNNEQDHRRRLYARSKKERDLWVHELRKASEVIPVGEDFQIGEELGKGRFSRVCLCVNKHTLERKAVKIIDKDSMTPEEKELLRAEIAIMKLVNHPNIIRMEAVYESRQHIYIVMELHPGGELFDRIVGRPRFSEDEAFTIMYPLLESVAYLHEMGIVHRDLKPENILCGGRIADIKIADFGLSKLVLPDEIMKMPCGTLSYVAPEVLTLNGYGREADIWSVGVIMYLLLRGRLPFDGDSREEIIENTINGTLVFTEDDIWNSFSGDARDLMLGMLNKDIKHRYTAKQVLRHPWVTTRVARMDADPSQFDFDSGSRAVGS